MFPNFTGVTEDYCYYHRLLSQRKGCSMQKGRLEGAVSGKTLSFGPNCKVYTFNGILTKDFICESRINLYKTTVVV